MPAAVSVSLSALRGPDVQKALAVFQEAVKSSGSNPSESDPTGFACIASDLLETKKHEPKAKSRKVDPDVASVVSTTTGSSSKDSSAGGGKQTCTVIGCQRWRAGNSLCKPHKSGYDSLHKSWVKGRDCDEGTDLHNKYMDFVRIFGRKEDKERNLLAVVRNEELSSSVFRDYEKMFGDKKADKSGIVRGKIDLSQYVQVESATMESARREGNKLWDWELFSTTMQQSRSWSYQRCVDTWRQMEKDPDVYPELSQSRYLAKAAGPIAQHLIAVPAELAGSIEIQDSKIRAKSKQRHTTNKVGKVDADEAQQVLDELGRGFNFQVRPENLTAMQADSSPEFGDVPSPQN